MKIVIVDDDVLVATSLKTILEANGVEVLGIGKDGNEAIHLYQKCHPDILLMDIRMEPMNGVDASRQILLNDKNAKILFLTTFQDDEYIIEALNLGVKGYILKQNYESILPSLEAVFQGQNVYNDEIITKIPTLIQNTAENKQDFGLSSKELDLLTLIAEGLSNKEIAKELFLSEGTVRNYLSSLLDKLALRDRTQLAIFYYKYLK